MTSKHLFFKAMREDMRHKYWMLALSCLGNFLFILVAWLIMSNNAYFDKNNMTPDRVLRYLNDAYQFYAEALMILAGWIALAGALIVGLFGFRYVFHKNMVDTWHSLPVKRTTLFGACWLNGFLIWFIPFLIGMILSLLLASGYVLEVCSYGDVSSISAIGMLCKEAAISIAALVVAFLLVYNTVLFAVMLSGNILNTLVSLGIIGFGVIGVYGLGAVFFESYMDTFYGNALNFKNVVYGSPLFSSGCLLYARAEYFASEPMERIWQFGSCGLINLLIAVGLGIGAWYLYLKRSSELAEQGIKNKILIAVMKLIVGVAGGMCGWLLLVALTGNGHDEIWGMFGCVLVSVLAFGILDIIFHMDFKVFFKHKIQMAVTTVLAMVICLAFCGDWFGYDKYIADKEDIAYISVFDNNFANRYYYYGSNVEVGPLKYMQYDDVDAIYNFLERMTGVTEHTGDRKEDVSYYYNSDRITTKVTLKNGKSYYRDYMYLDVDKDVIWPLITSEQYLQYAYLFDREDIEGCYTYYIEGYDDQYWIDVNKVDTNTVRTLMEAYNQDMLNNPEVILLNEGRALAQICFQVRDSSGDHYELYLDVYDSMSNTIGAMKQVGYEKWVQELDVAEVESIQLNLGYVPDISATPEQLIALARENYGYVTERNQKTEQELGEAYEIITCEVGEEPYITITDRDEIAEILQNCSYRSGFRSNVFGKGYVRITYVTSDGTEGRLLLKMGTLPEKYILRFGEIDLSEYGVSDYYQYDYYK